LGDYLSVLLPQLNPMLIGGCSVSSMAAAPASTVDKPEIIRAPVRKKQGPVFDHGTPDGKFDQLPDFDHSPKHSLLTRKQKLTNNPAPQFDEEPVDKLLRHFGNYFSKNARKVLVAHAKQNRASDSVVIEKLYHNLKMYLRDPQKNLMARLGVEKCLSHFNLISEFGLKGFCILTTDENDTREEVIVYTSSARDLVRAQDSVPYEDPFESRANTIRQQLLAGETEFVTETSFYPDGKLANAEHCLIYWCAIFPKLTKEEVVAIFKTLRSPRDLATVIAGIYSPHNKDRLMEIKLVQILSLLENEKLDATFTALLENPETRGVGVSILMDAQLFGGLQRALQFELMYERLVRTHDHWYSDYIDVVLNHSVVVDDESGFIGVRPLSIKEGYLFRLKAVREAPNTLLLSAALNSLTNLAFRKDCPHETKERIAGVLLEYATDNTFQDIREVAKEKLQRFRKTFYGDMDDAINFTLGADGRKKLGINVAMFTGKRGLATLKKMIEMKAYYSRDALIAYRQKTANIYDLDIMGIDIKGISWTGSHITLTQFAYIRAHETPNPDSISIDLTIEGASEAELLAYNGSFRGVTLVNCALSKQALLTLMKRHAIITYHAKHYCDYHFTVEEIRVIHNSSNYNFYAEVFAKQRDIDSRRECLDNMAGIFSIEDDEIFRPTLMEELYTEEEVKCIRQSTGTDLLIWIAKTSSQDFNARIAAFRRLNSLDDRQAKKIGNIVRGQETVPIKKEALETLGRVGSHSAITELQNLLASRTLPPGSIEAIHAMNTPAVLSCLYALTSHPHDTIQVAAFEAIEHIVDEVGLIRLYSPDQIQISSFEATHLELIFDQTFANQMRSNVLLAAIKACNTYIHKLKKLFTDDQLNAQLNKNKIPQLLANIVINKKHECANQAMVILKTFEHLPVVEEALAKVVAESDRNERISAALDGITPKTDTMLEALVTLATRKYKYVPVVLTTLGRSQNPKIVNAFMKMLEINLSYDATTKVMQTLRSIAASNRNASITMHAVEVLLEYAKQEHAQIFERRDIPEFDATTSVKELAKETSLGLEIRQPAIQFVWRTSNCDHSVPLARQILLENAPIDFQEEAIYVLGQYAYYWRPEDEGALQHIADNGVTKKLRKLAFETLNRRGPVAD
jgi:hypothetical protein